MLNICKSKETCETKNLNFGICKISLRKWNINSEVVEAHKFLSKISVTVLKTL